MTALNEAISEMVQVAFEKYEGVGSAYGYPLRVKFEDEDDEVSKSIDHL